MPIYDLFRISLQVVMHLTFTIHLANTPLLQRWIHVERYGFESVFEFDPLLSLVLYYATNTMEKHNPELETMLRYPAFHVDRGR